MLEENEFSLLLEEMKKHKENGSDEEDILKKLSDKNVSIIDTIKIDKELFHDTLAQAKNVVDDHPLWKEKHDQFEAFHKKLYKDLLDFHKDN